MEPFLMPFSEDPEDTVEHALAYLERRQWCKGGSWLVVITNALAHGKVIDTLQLRQVKADVSAGEDAAKTSDPVQET